MSLHGIRISGFSLCRYIRFRLSANIEAVGLSKKPWTILSSVVSAHIVSEVPNMTALFTLRWAAD